MLNPLYNISDKECLHWVLKLNWQLAWFDNPELIRTTMLEF